MKYYLYVSDTKVEMLYAQIPKGIRDRIVGELKLDLKVLSVSLKQAPDEETRYSKLQVVCDYLDREGVGTLDAPAGFFRGILPMSWGEFRFDWHTGPVDVAFFTGQSGAVMVGLGGSTKHLVVNAASAGQLMGATSGTPILMEFLASSSERLQGEQSLGSHWWAEEIAAQCRHPRTPPEPMEFMARLLAQENADGARVLLATPIYVASAA